MPRVSMTRGTRLSEQWQPSPELRSYAAGLGLSDKIIDRIAADFRDYWGDVPGARGLKLSWSGTWRVWCRREADKRKGSSGNDSFFDPQAGIL